MCFKLLQSKLKLNIPSLMRFFRPSVPILSQKLSSFSSFFVEIGVRGDLGRGDAIIKVSKCNAYVHPVFIYRVFQI